MTPEDRDLLQSLRHQQTDLRQALEKLNSQLAALEARSGVPTAVQPPPALPPLPLEAILPPIPTSSVTGFALPPVPTAAGIPFLPPVPKPAPSFESQFGQWLMRVGSVMLMIALAMILAWPKAQETFGPTGLFSISAIISLFFVIVGDRMEKKGPGSLFLGRALSIIALAWLYLTAYGATFYEPTHVVQSPLIAGVLLLACPLYLLRFAERKKSQTLGVFAITLAYFSTAIDPSGFFTMGADLILAATTAVFLLRNGWSVFAFFGIVFTYLALLRRLVIDYNGELVLDTSRALSFTPPAIYLAIAWLIFTAAVILTEVPTFRGGRRLTILSLNNAGLAILLALTAYIAGYGVGDVGWTLFATGLVFLVTSRFAGVADIDPVDIMGAYAAQGLALFTCGIIVIFTGMTRAVLLLIETFLIGVAGAFSGDRILTVSTYASSFFAAIFLIWEIAINAHHPWLFGLTGALVMLICAWNSRSEVRNGPMERTTIVASSSCYCIMAIALIYAAVSSELGDSSLPVVLALAALVLTFLIYYFSIYELPPLAQFLLIAAQILVVFPAETGEELPWWTTAWVAAITLLLLTWWSRQRVTRSGSWAIVMTFIYALALADLAHLAIRPYLDAQGWIIASGCISITFLVFGSITRVWSIAAVGQLSLALALYHVFFPPPRDTYPWNWFTAAVPILIVYITARAAHRWVYLSTDIPEKWRKLVRTVAYGYFLLAVVALARWVFAIVPERHQLAIFFLLSTLLLSMSVRRYSTFGVRCSFILSTIGMLLYFNHLDTLPFAPVSFATAFLTGLAVFLFICQPALIRHEGRSVVSYPETSALIFFAALTNLIFVSEWVSAHYNASYVTTSWTLFALFLFLLGSIVREPRLRWCGMGVIVAAILRLFFYDMWGLSFGFGVLTVIIMSLILFCTGLLILRRTARLENTAP